MLVGPVDTRRILISFYLHFQPHVFSPLSRHVSIWSQPFIYYSFALTGSVMFTELFCINGHSNRICIFSCLFGPLVTHCLFYSFAAQCAPFRWFWVPGQLHHDCCCKFCHLHAVLLGSLAAQKVVIVRDLMATGGNNAVILCSTVKKKKRSISGEGKNKSFVWCHVCPQSPFFSLWTSSTSNLPATSLQFLCSWKKNGNPVEYHEYMKTYACTAGLFYKLWDNE